MSGTAVRTRRFVALAAACALTATFARPLTGAQNPSLLFSTPITGSLPVRIAVDPQGFIYLAGRSSSPGVAASFVMKLTPSRSVVYTTFFQGTRFTGEPGDCLLEVSAMAVDNGGNAYITGCTTAADFPLVRPFRSTLQGSRGSGFVAKVGPAGNVLFSTYFGSGGSDRGTGISADGQGNAYVVGAASGPNLPLVSPASTRGPGFAAKFDSSGSSLLYSTYLGAVPRAIAIDRSGAAYLAGTGTLAGPAVRSLQPCHDQSQGADAIVIKLSPSGSAFDYATCLGGSQDDAATGIAIDAGGSAYVVGTTRSLDFPTLHPLDVPFRTGPLWKTDDAGATWTNLPLDAFSVNGLIPSNANRGTWYAATLFGGFKSVDGGTAWQHLGLPLRAGRFEPDVLHLAVDPRAPATIYASTSDGLFKSTDDGGRWANIGAVLPSGGQFLRAIAISPSDSRIVYAASQRGFWKSTDGGASWTVSNRGLGTDPFVGELSVDPATGALYADIRGLGFESPDRVFVSTDAGATWTPTALAIPRRTVTALTAVRTPRLAASPRTRGREPDTDAGATTTVYLAARQVFSEGPFGVLFRSGDGGRSWELIGEGLPPPGADALAVAPVNPAIVYAASRGVLFASRDRGETFEPVPGMPSFGSIANLTVDPRRPATVFVGTSPRTDAFVAKIHAGGGALDYSTYLGGAADDRAASVIVDDLGRAIVVGTTESADFPAVAAVQDRRSATDGFVSVIDGGGSVLLFSTWLGGNGADDIVSAVAAGRQILVSGGSTDLATMFPDSGTSGAGGFVGVLDLSFGASFRRLE
jgi:photosystem II stability/assembly factor-like uncharacterized protein